MAKHFNSYNDYEAYESYYSRNLNRYAEKPKHSKEWEELTEEYTFIRSVGMLSPKLLRLLTAYTENDLLKVVNEWKADDVQKEALHQSGLSFVREKWDKTSNINTDTLVRFYNAGINKYVNHATIVHILFRNFSKD